MYVMICSFLGLSYAVSVAGIWKTPVKNIRRQFSGYLGTCAVLLMFICFFLFF